MSYVLKSGIGRLIFYKNMNLVFCSKLNKEVDEVIINFRNNNNLDIGFIPSATSVNNKYFKEVEKHYKKEYGFSNVFCLDIDKNYDKKYFREGLKKCCILILSGGDTKFFLEKIMKRGLKEFFVEFAKNESNLLVGVSAGGIIMTENINTANILNKEAVENEQGLGLVDFEFFPHYNSSYERVIREYSLKNRRKIFVCSDDEVMFFNKEKKMSNSYYCKGRFYDKSRN